MKYYIDCYITTGNSTSKDFPVSSHGPAYPEQIAAVLEKLLTYYDEIRVVQETRRCNPSKALWMSEAST